MENDILVGVITHKREELCRNLIESLPDNIPLFCYKDGKEETYSNKFRKLFEGRFFEEGEENKGVAFAKKKIIDFFKLTTKNHLFIIEDDIIIKNPKVFQYYIEFSKKSGLLHLNWNDCMEWTKSYIFDVQYDENYDYTGRVTRDCAGAFQYFNREVINEFETDTNYINAWEHIDVELQLSVKGYNPPFWNWVTPIRSGDYLGSQEHGGQSTITDKPGYKENVMKGMQHWVSKWGYHINQIPQTNQKMVEECLKSIKRKYGNDH